MPAGTTWLDLVTLAIATGGLIVAVVSIALTIRRDREVGRVSLRLATEVDGDDLILRIVNPARRPVTIELAGLTVIRRRDRDGFTQWDGIDLRRHPTIPIMISDPALPRRLEPGDPSYSLRTRLYLVKNYFHPQVPEWAWAEDSYGATYWARIEPTTRSAISHTKRRVMAPEDEYGQSTWREVDDDADVAAEQLITYG